MERFSPFRVLVWVTSPLLAIAHGNLKAARNASEIHRGGRSRLRRALDKTLRAPHSEAGERDSTAPRKNPDRHLGDFMSPGAYRDEEERTGVGKPLPSRTI